MRASDAREGLGLHPCSQPRATGEAHEKARRPQVATHGGGARAEPAGQVRWPNASARTCQKDSCAASVWITADAKGASANNRRCQVGVRAALTWLEEAPSWRSVRCLYPLVELPHVGAPDRQLRQRNDLLGYDTLVHARLGGWGDRIA